jgi:beta-glucosidase
MKGMQIPRAALPGAGFVPAIERLGVPALFETDASLGVTNPRDARPGDRATALPSGLALASTWNSDLAFEAGAMIASEAACKGFNVLLAGGVNLTRDPRNGRNFEYLGEDPLLAGVLTGESVRGIQSQGIIATVKHFALNDQETGRHVVDATIDWAALHESDLLAFQIAIERGHPGSVMTAYNKVNGQYASENDYLLNVVLKGEWGYPGWVMADWGGTVSVTAAKGGLDQQSGAQLDNQVWFDAPLREAVKAGQIPASRPADMARRILRSMFAAGLFDQPGGQRAAIDHAANARVAQTAAEQGIVLLKNADELLPIEGKWKSMLVVGGQSDVGVLSGGGSSQVVTGNGHAAFIHVGGEGAMMAMASEAYHPSSPLDAIRARANGATVRFNNGRYPTEAAALAREADLVVVFATQWMTEGGDAPDLSLPNGQDALIDAIAASNSHTVVVLETGGPVLMPWLDKVAAVIEAWYPGCRGGDAIAAVLFGEVNPSGRLPITFPRSVEQLPRPQMPGYGKLWQGPAGAAADLATAPSFEAPHEEGSDVGYRWFASRGETALFPFGHGLSYTRFVYEDLEVSGGDTLVVQFIVKNIGTRVGSDVPQVYLQARNGVKACRLLGWSRVTLQPGESSLVNVTVDPRLVADFDCGARCWQVAAGRYEVAVGDSAELMWIRGSAHLNENRTKP